jgi:hypothetical protein
MSQINIDFQVLTNYNPKYLVVVDTSDWQNIKGKPSIIEITLPGFSDPIVHYFSQGQVNVFNSVNLGLNCKECGIKEQDFNDLPDGIYQITVKGSPSNFQNTRYFLKNDSLRLKLDMAFMKFNLGCNEFDKTLLEKLQKIDFLIKAAESNVRLGHQCEAQELMFRAEKEINKLKNCKSCV